MFYEFFMNPKDLALSVIAGAVLAAGFCFLTREQPNKAPDRDSLYRQAQNSIRNLYLEDGGLTNWDWIVAYEGALNRRFDGLKDNPADLSSDDLAKIISYADSRNRK
jgi:hypothetical protein